MKALVRLKSLVLWVGMACLTSGITGAHVDPPGQIQPKVIEVGENELSVAYFKRTLEGFWSKDTPKKAVFNQRSEISQIESLSEAAHDEYSIQPQAFLAPINDKSWLMVNPYEELYPAIFLLEDKRVKRVMLPFKKGKPMTCFGVAAHQDSQSRSVGYFLMSDSEPPQGEHFLEEPFKAEDVKPYYQNLKDWGLELWAYDLKTKELVFKKEVEGPVRAHGSVKISNLIYKDGQLHFVTQQADPINFPDSWFRLKWNTFDLKSKQFTEKMLKKTFQLSTLEIAGNSNSLWLVYSSIPKLGGLSTISVQRLEPNN